MLFEETNRQRWCATRKQAKLKLEERRYGWLSLRYGIFYVSTVSVRAAQRTEQASEK